MTHSDTLQNASSVQVLLALLSTYAWLEQSLSAELGAVHGLGLNEALLMLHLGQSPVFKLSRSDLAKRLFISASTVTRMAQPLEKLGLIGRELDTRDARLSYVTLTPAGQTLLAETKATLVKKSNALFSDLWTEAEISEMHRLLFRLNGALTRLMV